MNHRVTNAKRSERRILDRADHLFSSGCKTIWALDKGDEFQRQTGNREVDDVIKMACSGARILAGSNAVTIAQIACLVLEQWM